ncbi:MAG: GNAT family N-acetyltransferase [Proteobacteria bacterium]|nr:GNAT family N-acetyltransferase [Pseudomonadota bacterium]
MEPVAGGCTIRAATPADAPAAVPLIYSSGPATFDYVFAHGAAGAAQRFLHAAFVDGAGEFGWRNHVVVVDGGEVVAAGAAWDGRATLAFTLAAARQILATGLARAPGVIARGLAVERVIRPPRASEFYLAHLGVRPERRGQGLGAALVQALIARADPARHRVAALDVAVTNPRAESLYARLGFRVVAERPSRLASPFHAVPGHRRMERAPRP